MGSRLGKQEMGERRLTRRGRSRYWLSDDGGSVGRNKVLKASGIVEVPSLMGTDSLNEFSR